MAALRFVRPDRSRLEPHTAAEGVVTQSDNDKTEVDKVGATKGGLVPVVRADDTVSNGEASEEDGGTSEDGTTKGDITALEEARSAEGDATPLDVVPAEEGDGVTKPATGRETSSRGTGQLGEELAVERPSVIDSIAKVRAVAKQARKVAKRQRVERAVRRSNREATKVERAVAALSDEQRLRRRQQAKAARIELAQRQQATRKTSVVHTSAKMKNGWR
ncbi:hypothetical protein PR002_g2978 [Phytophthora rubi]|uniref:Uncharacterized protein n=1 Tax=Phytophthora rubi TaxID=129364 RepID=A0A6A3NSD9_9STRA|nr:hypothetical protein PR002_g2978 [Phytophthora rubi]